MVVFYRLGNILNGYESIPEILKIKISKHTSSHLSKFATPSYHLLVLRMATSICLNWFNIHGNFQLVSSSRLANWLDHTSKLQHLLLGHEKHLIWELRLMFHWKIHRICNRKTWRFHSNRFKIYPLVRQTKNFTWSPSLAEGLSSSVNRALAIQRNLQYRFLVIEIDVR